MPASPIRKLVPLANKAKVKGTVVYHLNIGQPDLPTPRAYYEAIRSSTPSQIEAIDMGRRGLHNEGSQTLLDRLSGKIDIDFDTARRLFTLVCVLHWRG